MPLEKHQKKDTWRHENCFVYRCFFFVELISMSEAFFPSGIFWRMLYDSIQISALETTICLFCSNFMPHTCVFVYRGSTRFFIAHIVTGTPKRFDSIYAEEVIMTASTHM